MNKENSKRTGVLVGGSGLIGGTLTHYFKTRTPGLIDLRAPNSKKLSVRNLNDIIEYMRRVRPAFIINAAISSIRSDAQLACEVNYLGSINLARAALSLNIPYIHFSSAVTMPSGKNLKEEDLLPLEATLSNYAKSKILTEKTLQVMHEKHGLDYTSIRLAIVYGEHDHKIQGLQRLLFSLIDKAMPVMLTRRCVIHSYTNCGKIPFFIHHILDNRQEFSGHSYNFVDPEPVELAKLILTIKEALGLKRPKEIYFPYPVARFLRAYLTWTLRILSYAGVEGRLPAELLFLEHFYKSQTLSSEKLQRSSFRDPYPETTVYSSLRDILTYYRTRWTHLNLISSKQDAIEYMDELGRVFGLQPERLFARIISDACGPFPELRDSSGNQSISGMKTA